MPADGCGDRGIARDPVAAAIAALGCTPEIFAAQLRVEGEAGCSADEAVGAAYEHLADPRHGAYAPGGCRAADEARAAAFRHGSRRQREAAGRLDSAARDLGTGCFVVGAGKQEAIGTPAAWQELVLCYDLYRMPVPGDKRVRTRARRDGITQADALRELRSERLRELALHDAAWALYPASTRRDQAARAAYRRQMLARYGFCESQKTAQKVQPQRAGRERCTPHRQRRSNEHGQMAFAGEDWRVVA